MAHQVADTVIRATSSGMKNVYVLSHTRWHAGIADEQTAAFNLVWALADRGRLKQGGRAAVVGDGPAAMSAAAALLAYGCVVNLYCPGRTLMSIQRHAAHRFEHPTLMSWPQRDLSLTTRFPVLDWYAAPVSEVASNLADQFKAVQPRLANVFFDSEVDRLSEMSGSIALHSKSATANRERYDCVILTEDFEGELTVPGRETESYWLPDNLEIERERLPDLTFVVSGTGNGGLTDALRLVHREFDRGKLLWSVAEELSRTSVARRIADIEAEHRDARTPDALANAYADTVSDMPLAVRERLNRSIESGPEVVLVGRQPAPFNASAAPILKLLVMHALRTDRLRYQAGRVDIEAGSLRVNETQYGPADTRLIVRHGFRSNLHRLLSADDYENIRSHSNAFNLSEPLWASPYPSPGPSFPIQDFHDPEFISSRLKLASQAIRTRFGDSSLKATERGFSVKFANRTEHVPAQLFGIELTVEEGGLPLIVPLADDDPPVPPITTDEPSNPRTGEHETDFSSDDAEGERDDLSRSIIAISLGRHLHRIWQRYNQEAAPIADQENPPAAFVVHLDAPWGGGKTTFANYLARVLNPVPRGGEPAAFLRERYPNLDVGGIFLGDPPASAEEKLKSFSLPESERRPWIIVNFNAWENEHCSPPWWVFFQTIRKQCFRAIRKEGTHPWCSNKSPDGMDFVRRHWAFLGLQWREFWWRLFNPKIATLLATAALSLLALTLLKYFNIWGPKVVDGKTEIGFLASSGIGLLLLGLGSGTAIWGAAALVTESVVPGTDTLAERLSLGKGDPFGRFRRHFNRTMRRLKRPVMVVVDDLDRCSPEFVVDLVRGMQTLLRSPRVVFVILGDRDWIERAFEGHHKTMSELDVGPEQRLGARFVEKAIQMSFILPSIAGDVQVNFVRQILLGSRGGRSSGRPPFEPEVSSQLREVVNSSFAADPSSVDRPDTIISAVLEELRRIDPDRTESDLGADADQIKGIVFDTLATNASSDDRFEKAIVHQLESLASHFPPNPRQIKRIVNAITMYASVMLQQRLETESPAEFRFQLAIWIIIMTEWPRSWRTIVSCPEIVDCIAAGKTLDAVTEGGKVSLPGSKAETQAELERILADPKLKGLIAGDAALGNAPLSVESVRILRELTPLYSRGTRLSRPVQAQGEPKVDRKG